MDDATFIDCSEICIVCGALAQSLNGTFSMDGTGKIVSAKNMRPEDLNLLSMLLDAIKSSAASATKSAELRSVIQKVENGFLDEGQAETALSKIDPEIARFYATARKKSWSISFILDLITLAVAFYTLYDSNIASNQAHTDAVKMHEAYIAQTELLMEQNQLLVEKNQSDRDQKEILQHLHEALLAQRMIDEQKAKKAKPKQTRPQQMQGINRHERRKAAAQGKQR